MLRVCGNNGPNTGPSLMTLQPVETPTAEALEGGGEGNGLQSRLVPAGTGIGAILHGDMS